MSLFRRPSKEPLWKDEFSINVGDERYVNRRQFTKFLVLTSLGMFVGNLWILGRSLFVREPEYPEKVVAGLDDIPVGGVKLFRYPSEKDPCILVRTSSEKFVAYSQKCTHLTCPVYFAKDKNRLECPCHEGYFSVETGEVLQGPPPRPLPRVVLEKRGTELVAVRMDKNVRH